MEPLQEMKHRGLSISDIPDTTPKLPSMDVKKPPAPPQKPDFTWETGDAPEWSKRTPTDYSGMFGYNTSPFDFLNQIHKLDQFKK